MISETTGYMTQEEAAMHVEKILAMRTLEPYKTREERAREKQELKAQRRAEGEAEKQKLSKAAQRPTVVDASQWVRFLRKSIHAEIGDFLSNLLT